MLIAQRDPPMNRHRNTYHLVSALADRREFDNLHVMQVGLSHAERQQRARIEERLDRELDHLGLDRHDIDDYDQLVSEEIRRRRTQRRSNKRTVDYSGAFNGMLASAGL
jgi:hypothetical protein